MDWNKLSEDERMLAEQAVATFRAVRLAGDRALHGQGLCAPRGGPRARRRVAEGHAAVGDERPGRVTKRGLASELPVRGQGEVQFAARPSAC